ncbi:hypothetical protein SteCoe_26207 [Stentor coeruleus]|uniref:Carbohydrate-binding module family 96 domain-containing protein n=1 Tax=Stentor coeruleus TaxID=5963 RepID=A0A1R2BDE4_9CILI|nr:hypothetical protein SteCoe_26207 [Stentor coeruleus]
METPISLVYKNEVKFFMSSVIRVIAIQTLFNISSSNIWLQDVFDNVYFPNSDGEILNLSQKIFSVQPSTTQMKLETIFINRTDSRFVSTSGEYNPGNHLTTGSSIQWKNTRNTIVQFGNLTSVGDKNIVKAYLRLYGNSRCSNCCADPKEVTLHRIEEYYFSTTKWADQPNYTSEPVTSIMVGETGEARFSWDITGLTKSWIDKKYPNYGLLLKQNESWDIESTKYFAQNARTPTLEVIYLVTN